MSNIDLGLKPVVTSRAYIQIARQIADIISQGVLKPGVKLPPERTLAEQLRVSRPSVREALSALEILGILESRIGDGTYVKRSPLDVPLIGSMFDDLSETQESPLEVTEARLGIEPFIVRLATERATQDQLTAIGEAIERMSQAIRKHHSHVDSDVGFHLSIAAAAGNSVLLRQVGVLVRIMHTQMWDQFNEKTVSTPRQLDRFLHDHQRIFKAMTSRNKKEASAQMAVHLEGVIEFFFGGSR